MKTIVSHTEPDLDAITSIWLIKTFMPGWDKAEVVFLPEGKKFKGIAPDASPDVLYVDVGHGKFDHHQSNQDTCASILVYEEIKKLAGIDDTLEKLLRIVNDSDHFRDVFLPNPTDDIWDFSLNSQINGWHILYRENDLKVTALAFECLDGIYQTLKAKIKSRKEIDAKGIKFKTKWGDALGIETNEKGVERLSRLMGYFLFIRKEPVKGFARIKMSPSQETAIDLEPLYNKLRREDKSADWYLHPGHLMLLNGSAKNPLLRPTKKTLQELIDMVKAL